MSRLSGSRVVTFALLGFAGSAYAQEPFSDPELAYAYVQCSGKAPAHACEATLRLMVDSKVVAYDENKSAWTRTPDAGTLAITASLLHSGFTAGLEEVRGTLGRRLDETDVIVGDHGRDIKELNEKALLAQLLQDRRHQELLERLALMSQERDEDRAAQRLFVMGLHDDILARQEAHMAWLLEKWDINDAALREIVRDIKELWSAVWTLEDTVAVVESDVQGLRVLGEKQGKLLDRVRPDPQSGILETAFETTGLQRINPPYHPIHAATATFVSSKEELEEYPLALGYVDRVMFEQELRAEWEKVGRQVDLIPPERLAGIFTKALVWNGERVEKLGGGILPEEIVIEDLEVLARKAPRPGTREAVLYYPIRDVARSTLHSGDGVAHTVPIYESAWRYQQYHDRISHEFIHVAVFDEGFGDPYTVKVGRIDPGQRVEDTVGLVAVFDYYDLAKGGRPHTVLFENGKEVLVRDQAMVLVACEAGDRECEGSARENEIIVTYEQAIWLATGQRGVSVSRGKFDPAIAAERSERLYHYRADLPATVWY